MAGSPFRQLETVFRRTTTRSLERNVRLLEEIGLAKTREKKARNALCGVVARAMLSTLGTIDREQPSFEYGTPKVDRAKVFAGLARTLLAAGQFEELSRLVAHAFAHPDVYPLSLAHVAALTTLRPWLKKNVKKSCPQLSQWITACCGQLESLTAAIPQPPADFRRAASLSCKCADCADLKRFLQDPHEQQHSFRVKERRRKHLRDVARWGHCDLDLRTDTETRTPWFARKTPPPLRGGEQVSSTSRGNSERSARSASLPG